MNMYNRYFHSLTMEGERVFFDASPYMVFEESGDSEAESYGYDGGKVETAAAAEEDAQSCCSYGCISDSMSVQEEKDYDDWCEVSDEEGEEGIVDQCEVAASKLNKSEACLKKLNVSSHACEGSNVDERERDRDRLFWEACLAS